MKRAMKFPSISVKYNWRGYQSKRGTYMLHLRVYYKGKVTYLPMGNIPPIQGLDWIGDEAKGLYVKHPSINKLICEQLNECRNWSYEQILQGRPLSADGIREQFYHPEIRQSFNEWCKYYVRNINKNKASHEKRAPGTVAAYQSYLKKLDIFSHKINFDEITPSLIEGFDRFLATKYDLRGRTRDKYFDKFKNCYKAAAKKGLVNYNPLLFSDLKFPDDRKERVSLVRTEILKMLETKLKDPTDEFYKNLFLFKCFTSLYYSDVKQLLPENFGEESISENGKVKKIRYIKGNRYKNDEGFVIPLFKEAIHILDTHSNWRSAKKGEPIFQNLVTDQKYNDRLKRIAKQLDIDKNLSAKVGRHSFSDLARSMGVAEGQIQRAMGHKLISTQQEYGRASVSGALFGWKDLDL